MNSRTVRLDDETERIPEDLTQEAEAARTGYQIYEELDLGPGGYAISLSTETRRGVKEAIRRKLRGNSGR
jgi:hypothetical protein